MMNSDQIAFAHPPRSGLRKMSPNTTISSQIQMKNMKNQSIDQKTWPLPKSAITMFHPPTVVPSPALRGATASGQVDSVLWSDSVATTVVTWRWAERTAASGPTRRRSGSCPDRRRSELRGEELQCPAGLGLLLGGEIDALAGQERPAVGGD